jgi:hypothetical protein
MLFERSACGIKPLPILVLNYYHILAIFVLVTYLCLPLHCQIDEFNICISSGIITLVVTYSNTV